MGRIFTIAAQYLATLLVLTIGLSVDGCGDSATVNPVAELGSLTVTPGSLQPGFKGSTTEYSAKLSTEITSVTVQAQAAVSGDTVTINGQRTGSSTIPLGDPGSTTPVSIVVSESGNNSRSYTVLLERAGLGGNNSLQTLSVSPEPLDTPFDPNTLLYNVDVANTVTSVAVTPTLQDLNATMTVNGQATPSGVAHTVALNGPGQPTTITIIVTAQNGTPKTYLVTVSRGASGNNSLKGLTISPGKLDRPFSAGTVAYTLNVPSVVPTTVTGITVTPTLQDTTASMTVNGQPTNSGQTRTSPLPLPGSSTFINIVVTAQNGTQNTYAVNVIRKALSGNNDLQSLTLSPGGLTPAFSAGRTSYTVGVGGRVDSITVTAAPDDTNARMTINGQGTNSGQARSIALGPDGSSTEIQIIVTAQDGSQRPYLITVNRAALSSDNNLETLTVTPGTLEPAFAQGTLAYAVEVATGITSVEISAAKSDSDAVISGDVPNQGQAVIQLDGPGTSKTVSITVTAPNGLSKTYAITVTRLAPSTDSNLSNLTVSAGSLNPGFAPGTLNYTIDVASTVDSITASATKSDPEAVMSALGTVIAPPGTRTGSATFALGLGTSTSIAITVIAENRVSTKTYTITVSRPFR